MLCPQPFSMPAPKGRCFFQASFLPAPLPRGAKLVLKSRRAGDVQVSCSCFPCCPCGLYRSHLSFLSSAAPSFCWNSLGSKALTSPIPSCFLKLSVFGRCCLPRACTRWLGWTKWFPWQALLSLCFLFSSEEGGGFVGWPPSSPRCCVLGCSWIEARDGKGEVGLQEPQPPELRILPASSQLLVWCLGLVPCSGKPRLCAELCLLLFFFFFY